MTTMSQIYHNWCSQTYQGFRIHQGLLLLLQEVLKVASA
jgi:hypothetical protein